MARDARYRLRLPEITVESFEGESIVIDFASGCYFSLSSSAAEILALLISGASEEQALARMVARHPDGATRLETDFDALLGRLLAERIVLAGDPSPAPSVAPAASDGVLPGTNAAYEPPLLERFEDMREMLLLDPIHELDQATWGGSTAQPPGPGTA